MRKDALFVVDTNVLLHDSYALRTLAASEVYLPASVLEELDHFKRDVSDLGRNARHALLELETAFEKSSTKTSEDSQRLLVAKTLAGGHLTLVSSAQDDQKLLPSEFVGTKGDDNLLSIAKRLKAKNLTTPIVVLSKDRSLRIKALTLGVEASEIGRAHV